MRRSYNDIGWIENNGEAIGLALGFDFCAEHEWGVKDIKMGFGIPSSEFPNGPSDRKVTIVPQNLLFQEYTETHNNKTFYRAALIYSSLFEYKDTRAKFMDHKTTAKTLDLFGELKLYKFPNDPGYDGSNERNDFATAWSGRDFGIIVQGKNNITNLKNLFEAFKRKDICLGGQTMGNSFLKRGGLTFMIFSKLPADVVAATFAADASYKKLHLAARKTGILERLKKAGRSYYACSPRWKDKSEKEIIFWLNPMEQQKNNYGWFTVEDLDDWIRGEGKIPKT